MNRECVCNKEDDNEMLLCLDDYCPINDVFCGSCDIWKHEYCDYDFIRKKQDDPVSVNIEHSTFKEFDKLVDPQLLKIKMYEIVFKAILDSYSCLLNKIKKGDLFIPKNFTSMKKYHIFKEKPKLDNDLNVSVKYGRSDYKLINQNRYSLKLLNDKMIADYEFYNSQLFNYLRKPKDKRWMFSSYVEYSNNNGLQQFVFNKSDEIEEEKFDLSYLKKDLIFNMEMLRDGEKYLVKIADWRLSEQDTVIDLLLCEKSCVYNLINEKKTNGWFRKIKLVERVNGDVFNERNKIEINRNAKVIISFNNKKFTVRRDEEIRVIEVPETIPDCYLIIHQGAHFVKFSKFEFSLNLLNHSISRWILREEEGKAHNFTCNNHLARNQLVKDSNDAENISIEENTNGLENKNASDDTNEFINDIESELSDIDNVKTDDLISSTENNEDEVSFDTTGFTQNIESDGDKVSFDSYDLIQNIENDELVSIVSIDTNKVRKSIDSDPFDLMLFSDYDYSLVLEV